MCLLDWTFPTVWNTSNKLLLWHFADLFSPLGKECYPTHTHRSNRQVLLSFQIGWWAVVPVPRAGILCGKWWHCKWELGRVLQSGSASPRGSVFLWISNCNGKHPLWNVQPADRDLDRWSCSEVSLCWLLDLQEWWDKHFIHIHWPCGCINSLIFKG